MIFQRQGCSSTNSSFIDNNSSTQQQLQQLEAELSSSNISRTMIRHQSPTTSSQTITTIASINRSSDNEFTLTSSQSLHESGNASRPPSAMILDGRSLIREIRASQHCQMDDASSSVYVAGNQRVECSVGGHETVINDTLDEKFNCNTSSSSKSRFTNDIHTRSREFSCNKEESVSIMDHKTDASSCKNVNMCSMSELNKNLTSLVHLASPQSMSSFSCNDDGAKYADDRCEIDVR